MNSMNYIEPNLSKGEYMNLAQAKFAHTALPTIERPLTPNEHRFLNAPNGYISLVVRVNGPITDSVFRKAVNAARRKHPLLGARIAYDHDYRSSFLFEDVPENPVSVVEKQRDDQWYEALLNEHRTYVDVCEGPLVRFALLKGSPSSDFIIFANHAVCDGMSLCYLARDIVQAMAESDSGEIHEVPSIPMTDANLGGSMRAGGLAGGVMKIVEKKWEGSRVHFDGGDFRSLHAAFWRAHTYNICYRQLTAKKTSDLLARCRSEGVTVNTAICTAFSSAIRSEHGGFENYMGNLGIAVDLRDRFLCDNKEFFGLSASGVKPKFRYNPKKPFWENARVLHKKIRSAIQADKQLSNAAAESLVSHSMSDAMLVAGLAGSLWPTDHHYDKMAGFRNDDKNIVVKMLKRKGVLDLRRMQLAYICTNLRRVPFPASYEPFSIESMIFAPSSGLLMECVLGIVTVNGKLNLTVGNVAKKESANRMESLADRALSCL